jgi:hypothetical protein
LFVQLRSSNVKHPRHATLAERRADRWTGADWLSGIKKILYLQKTGQDISRETMTVEVVKIPDIAVSLEK